MTCFFDNDFYDKMKKSLPEDDDISHLDLDEPDINNETQLYYDEDEDAYNKRITADEEKLEKFSQKELDKLDASIILYLEFFG